MYTIETETTVAKNIARQMGRKMFLLTNIKVDLLIFFAKKYISSVYLGGTRSGWEKKRAAEKAVRQAMDRETAGAAMTTPLATKDQTR